MVIENSLTSFCEKSVYMSLMTVITVSVFATMQFVEKEEIKERKKQQESKPVYFNDSVFCLLLCLKEIM